MSMNTGRMATMCAIAALIAMPTIAEAATGTAAGTDVQNTATVSFSVGGTSQTATSNTATFKVDKKVNLAIAVSGGTPTYVALGANSQVMKFTVTNLTNSVQDFRLDVDQQNVSIPVLGVDNFDMNNLRVYVDDGDGVFNPALDTRTYIDELAPDANATVFVVGDVPNQAGSNVAIVSLRAIAAAGGTANSMGADLTATVGVDSANAVDVVFADDASPLDLARNGQLRAFSAYKIATAAISINKTSTVISDPLNLAVLPKAIPGATVEYCLVVTNAGPGTATDLVIADPLPAHTAYVANSLRVGGVATGGQCVLNGSVEDDDATGADESDPYGGSFDGTTVRATLPTLTTVLPLAISFQVTLN